MLGLIFSVIISVIVSAILLPIVAFWLSYFSGWLCSLAIGDVLVQGLNTLFNTTHFTEEMIPVCAGTIGWLGAIFMFFLTGGTKSATNDIIEMPPEESEEEEN